MHATITTAAVTTSRSHRWRVVDIVTAAVLAVVSGVIYWGWAIALTPLSIPFAFLPGLSGVLNFAWLFAGPLAALVVRKPGAALFAQLIAAVVEALIGDQFGFSSVLYGLLQGAAAEAVFAAFAYRRWNLPVALGAGLLAGLANALLDLGFYYADTTGGFKLVYLIATLASGLVAAVVAWALLRALAATGALSRFASGRTARTAELDDDAA